VRLLKQSLFVIAVMIVGFITQRQTGIAPATMAMAGAALLMLLDNVGRSAEQQSQNVHAALSEAEWITLMFFLGLFILVHGVVKVGLIDMAAKLLCCRFGGRSRWVPHVYLDLRYL
jgi:Na+/H+ antiporter NhaD/arsenite permease-like protein